MFCSLLRGCVLLCVVPITRVGHRDDGSQTTHQGYVDAGSRSTHDGRAGLEASVDQGDRYYCAVNRRSDIVVFQNREKVASTIHRQDTITGLKKFNARRKLKVRTTLIAGSDGFMEEGGIHP